MALKVRRIITGHDQNGKAIAKIDEVVSERRAELSSFHRIQWNCCSISCCHWQR